jgi:hypothetical protein
VFSKSILVSAIAVALALYVRSRSRKELYRGSWDRFDRHAPLDEIEEDSFPASDPPSSVPSPAWSM